MNSPDELDAPSADNLAELLAQALSEVASMSDGPQRTWAMRGIATLLMNTPQSLRASALKQWPELSGIEPIPETHLTAEEEAAVQRLTPVEVQEVDRALLAAARVSWQSTARVIGDALVTLQLEANAVPLGFFMQRVEALVQLEELDSQGNTHCMHLSEVRLPQSGSSAA